MIDAADLGRVLRAKRERAKMTRDDLADKLGINRSTLLRWEHGVGLNTVVELARAMQMCESAYMRLKVDSGGD